MTFQIRKKLSKGENIPGVTEIMKRRLKRLSLLASEQVSHVFKNMQARGSNLGEQSIVHNVLTNTDLRP